MTVIFDVVKLIFETDLDRVKMNQLDKYLSHSSKVIVGLRTTAITA